MNLPWKLKSFVFGCIEFFNAPRLLYFLQKNVTKRSRVGVLRISPVWQSHKEYIKKYESTGKVFEFGAGKTLAQNLYLSDIVSEQIVVDLNPMIDFELVEKVREQLTGVVNLKSTEEIKNLENLKSYGIQYWAPYDAANTNFSNKSIDACISTNTLEHIPEESITAIFSELYRTLKDDGIISAKIDYSDHYAHTDKSISLLNYLKFDSNDWKKHNHNSHYQNRLRHYDYLDIFRKTGFVVVEEKVFFDEKDIPYELVDAFKNNDETWKATSAHIILKKVT